MVEVNTITYEQCFSMIENGIIIDLGHESITMWAIENYAIVDSEELSGGITISKALETVLSLETDDKFGGLWEYTGTLIKDGYCEVSLDVNQSLKV